MIVLSLAEIAAVTGGTLADVPDPHACVTGPAVSDSRQVAPGGLFARLRCSGLRRRRGLRARFPARGRSGGHRA